VIVLVRACLQDLIGSCARWVLEELRREAIPEAGWADVVAQVLSNFSDSSNEGSQNHPRKLNPRPRSTKPTLDTNLPFSASTHVNSDQTTQVEGLSERFEALEAHNTSLRQIVSGLQSFASRAATAGEQSLRLVTSRHQGFTRNASGSNTPRNASHSVITEEAVTQKLEPSLPVCPEAESEESEEQPGGDWKDIAVRRVFSGVLAVKLHKATGLKAKMFGTRDPYAVLRMRSVSDMKVWRSSAKSNTRSPTWDEQTSFLVQVYSFIHSNSSPSQALVGIHLVA
jgi:hypothetical protein